MVELVPISRTGFNKLKEELERLQTKELPEVRQAVAEAREHGDLKENGEYIAGRERQGFIQGRIAELKGQMNRADIVDCTQVDCSSAVFGTVVSLLDLDTDEKVTYQLLGPDDADFNNGSISISSPVGQAILGHVVGDELTVSIPRGDRNFKVLAIEKSSFD